MSPGSGCRDWNFARFSDRLYERAIEELTTFGNPDTDKMARRLIALLIIGILLGFSAVPLFSIPVSDESCSCGCTDNGGICRCSCQSKHSDPAAGGFEAFAEDPGDKCPCTAAGLSFLALKVHAILRDPVDLTGLMPTRLDPPYPGDQPLSGPLQSKRQRAPPC